ncbi:hypothetical protein WJX75_003531 [Coccomyxa subellipsoidea]|uniref:Magnesium transporter n=1 Tax=Coccomyxa subellipsoidea TaxID=248742 RepID=A0ABR2Z103_9CHLO
MHCTVCIAVQGRPASLLYSQKSHSTPVTNAFNYFSQHREAAILIPLRHRNLRDYKCASKRVAGSWREQLHVSAESGSSKMAPDHNAAITGQVLILYSALTCASTPVALRYLYLQPHPPASPVLAAVQTGFAAVIMCVISGGLRLWKKGGEGHSEVAVTSDDEEWQVENLSSREAPEQGGMRRRGSDSQGLLERNGSSFSVESAVLPESSNEERE